MSQAGTPASAVCVAVNSVHPFLASQSAVDSSALTFVPELWCTPMMTPYRVPLQKTPPWFEWRLVRERWR